MKVSRLVLVVPSLAVLFTAGCSDDGAVDNPTSPTSISAAATITPGVTGGGTFVCQDGDENEVIVTHGFDLRCEAGPNRLQLNWSGNRFTLRGLQARECDEDEEEGEFEIEIDGTGKYNGQSGAVICASFADAGEPGGGVDEVEIVLLEPGGACDHGGDEVEFEGEVILECLEVLLTSGDHNAHF